MAPTGDKNWRMLSYWKSVLTKGKVNHSDANAESNDERWNRRLKEIVKDGADRSSIHSFPSFASERVPLAVKIIWIVSVAVSWGYLIYQINNSIVLYNKFGVVSSITVGFEAPTPFPAVDICNMNPYDNTYAKTQMIISDTLAAKNITPYGYPSIKDYTDAANNQFKYTIEYLSVTNQTEAHDLGFDLSEMLLSCNFQGKQCSVSDFYYYHDYNFGNCYRFNGGLRDGNQSGVHNYTQTPIRMLQKSGWMNGLRLELYAGSQNGQQKYGYKTGFRIIVHNQSVIPFPNEDGIDVGAGVQTNVAVSRSFVEHLPYPFNDCVDELTTSEADDNRYLQEMYTQVQTDMIPQYMQKYCLKLCYQHFIIDHCNCSSLSFSYLKLTTSNVSGCISNTQMSCMSSADALYYNSNQVNLCYESCPIECNSITYDLLARMAQYPTEWYADMFKEYDEYFGYYDRYNDESASYDGPTYEMISKTSAMINVFYYSMQYQVVSETPSLTFDLLLANVGGNLGLFTGMSFLSFMEFAEVVLTFAILTFCMKKKQTPN